MADKTTETDTAGSRPSIVWQPPKTQLRPLSAEASKKWIGELLQGLRDDGHDQWAELLSQNQKFTDFLGAVFSLSSHLRNCALVRPQILVDILSAQPEDALSKVMEKAAPGPEGETLADLMIRLRRAKTAVSLLCGLADLGGWWDCRKVTRTLSDFADQTLNAAITHLLRDLGQAGKLNLSDPKDPQSESGLIVLGMGKYGARELNYSSDIDIILFFEYRPEVIVTDDPISAFTRLAKNLIRIMQERTGDGYVFRIDLRLRPDPGSTPLVIPVDTALNYYEAYGQNWERAAMIKARAVAGDKQAGDRFLRELSPFIWRKYLDYAAISDVHSIKRQIHAHRGHAEVAVAGHNIKLGRGGIREIEFFAQTQQLIAGGRLPALRCLRTVEALGALHEEGWIDASARDELAQAYWYLRDIEHRIQMVADEQTHTLPEDDEGLTRIALMMGAAGIDEFSQSFTKTLRTVERHYAGLFESSPTLGSDVGNLVFTGDVDDPSTLDTLAQLGYANPSQVIRIVRGWHFGRFAAVRSAAAREILTEMTPGLLAEIAASGEADTTLAAFDRFLAGLPAGIQLFSLIKSNPPLMQLLLLILGSAPRLGDIITRKPHVFDGMLEPAFAGTVPDRRTLTDRLKLALEPASQYEAALDIARIFAAEQKFLIGIRLLTQTFSVKQAGRAYANLAEVLIAAMVERVVGEFERRHGRIPGASVCVLGMGRLGSRDLTAGSDLDLILLYDHDEDADHSDGQKPLAASQYFIRLTQRLIAAMSAPTSEGVIYELDFRLRPSGNAGPVATSVVSFLKYQENEAWTWERQALTRARPVAGDPALCDRVADHVIRLLAQPIDPKKLAGDIAEMRQVIDEEKPAQGPFDVKTVPGGLIDIEFIAQWATLRGGLDASAPRTTAIDGLIQQADPALLSADARELLIAAYESYNRVLQLSRVCIDGTYNPEDAPGGLTRTICLAFDLPTIDMVEAHLRDQQEKVRNLFNQLLK